MQVRGSREAGEEREELNARVSGPDRPTSNPSGVILVVLFSYKSGRIETEESTLSLGHPLQLCDEVDIKNGELVRNGARALQ